VLRSSTSARILEIRISVPLLLVVIAHAAAAILLLKVDLAELMAEADADAAEGNPEIADLGEVRAV